MGSRKTKGKRRGTTPTDEQFSAYEGAFNYFNQILFEGQLAPLMLNFSRRANSRGFYFPEAWRRGKDQAVAELSLNPDVLDRPPRDSLSTLVHEMVHHWQFSHGIPSRRGYHNKEWAAKMMEVGLHPSHTGEPGGDTVGQHMTHYIVEGGPFDRAFLAIPPEILLPWTSAGGTQEAKKKKQKTRQKTAYACPGCEAKVWGKPDLFILCGHCEERLEEETV